jgi:imidazolonepropionase-like amidohydrolase
VLSYKEAGIPAADVMRFATYNGAKALGILDQVGIIKKGMKANLTAFNGDLENNFEKALFDVKAVVRNGELVYRSTAK